MPADFPNNPAVGDTFTGANGATYTWDGVKWVNTGCPAGSGGGLDNLAAGTCITLPKTGDIVTVNASIPCIQTPWLQNINGGGFQLSNTSAVQTSLVAAPPGNILTLNSPSSVNIGVGSSTPVTVGANSVAINWTAQLNATASGQNPMLTWNNSLGNAWSLMEDSGSVTTNALRLRYNTTNEWMTWLPNGNVGMGTPTPNVKLHTYSTASDGADIRIQTTGDGAFLIVQNGPSGAFSGIQGFNSTGVIDYVVGHWGLSGPGMNFMIGPTPSEAMRIIANGNVGIGTSAPSTLLDVAGSIRCTGYTSATSGVGVELVYNAGAGFVQCYNRATSAFVGLIVSGLGVQVDGHGGNVLLQPSGGNVGINQTSPAVTLDVNGIIYPSQAISFSGDHSSAINGNLWYGIGQSNIDMGAGPPNYGLQMAYWSGMMLTVGGGTVSIGQNGFVGISNANTNFYHASTLLDVNSTVTALNYRGQAVTHFAAPIFAEEEQPVSGSGQQNGTVLFNFQSPQTQMQLQYRRSNGQLYYATIQMTLISG